MHDDDLDPTTLPLDEQTALLQRDSTRLDIAERELAAARRAYEAHVVNGTHADIAEVRERLEAQYGSPLRKAEEAAVKLARVVGERARGVMTAAQTPPLRLSAGETVEMGAFLPVAEYHCRALRMPELVTTIRAAVVSGDRPRMYAYAQYLPAALAVPSSEIGGYRPDPAAREKAELKRLLGVIRERLADPAFEPVRARAADLVSRASNVGHDAGARAREAYRATHPFAFQGENDVKRWDK